jgi:D-alanyl-lipoteichoic acid acyltransferase DltB (MBOAT superfamily)
MYAFAAQIYCDFSAYTDIARGLAKLFGIELTRNFLTRYLSQSPSDFWQRWPHLAVAMVAGLPLHPAGRQSPWAS